MIVVFNGNNPKIFEQSTNIIFHINDRCMHAKRTICKTCLKMMKIAESDKSNKKTVMIEQELKSKVGQMFIFKVMANLILKS